MIGFWLRMIWVNRINHIENSLIILNYRIVQMNSLNQDQKVRCSLDEPIQRLMEKLSTKSLELYTFWQNYNLLYNLYSEKITEVEILKTQITNLKTQPVANPAELQLLKERQFRLEKQFEDLRMENQRLRLKLNESELNNHRLIDENTMFQTLIKQFKDQNQFQKEEVQRIIARLRDSENSAKVTNESKYLIQQQLMELKRSQFTTGDLKRQLADKDSQISFLTTSIQNYKRQFQRILTEAVRNCKIRLCESLPDIVQTCKVTNLQKTVVVNNI